MTIEGVGIDGGDTSTLEEWLKSQEACKQQRDLEERIKDPFSSTYQK